MSEWRRFWTAGRDARGVMIALVLAAFVLVGLYGAIGLAADSLAAYAETRR